MTQPAHGKVEGLSAAAQRILHERAQALALPLEEADAPARTLELLTFSCAGSGYAVLASDAVAVVPVGKPTPVPGAPRAVRGVVNHRGRILAVVDAGRLVAAAEHDASESDLGIVVATGDASFVLVSESVPELVSLDESEVSGADRPDGVLRGVTATMVAVLDVAALALDPRVAVEHEFA